MKRRQRHALIAKLDEKLEYRGSWCGETHLQKSLYFLQALLGVPTDFDFVLYKYGPFSRDVRAELAEMRADGFLDLVLQPAPYGPSLHATQAAREQLETRWPKTLRRYDGALELIANHLGGLGVGELERLATALWVTQELPSASEATRAQRIQELKPHVSEERARAALKQVGELEVAADSLN